MIAKLNFQSFSFICQKFYFYISRHFKFDFYLKKFDLIFFLNFIKLHSSLKFNIIIDVAVVDLQNINNRFKLIYNFLSSLFWQRLSINYFLNETDFAVSLKKIFMGIDWIEREIWDMFGIFFINHYDLRRILTDYGFRGFPLKKDFPLTGYIELRFDDSKRDIVYEPVELAQELRFFNFSSGWEKE